MELIVVVAITGLLVLGLGAVVEIPRDMAEQELSGDARLSDLDRLVKWLDDDVRFAKDVVRPSATRLEVTTRDGQTVVYAWGGGGGPLTRTDANGSVALVESAARVIFQLGKTPLPAEFADGTTSESVVEAASFDTFTLLPGFSLLGGLLGGLLKKVDLLTGTLLVTRSEPAGVAFTVSGLSGEGYVESVRLRLRKSGTQSLMVRLLEFDPDDGQPDSSGPNVTTVVHQNALPSALTDFTIPLPAARKVKNGDRLFVELVATGNGGAVELAYELLSIAAAAAPVGGGLLRSTGGLFAPLAATLDASQCVFSVQVREIEAESGGAADAVVLVPTSVHATIQVQTPNGVSMLATSFPVENNLARVHR